MAEKRRALVLGGGGPVGVGWETGLAAGLADAGVDLALADTVIGTSAGSITGSYLASGEEPRELAGRVAELFARNTEGTGVDAGAPPEMGQVMELLIGAIADDGDGTVEERLAAVGKVALELPTVAEEAYVGALARALDGRAWPAGFSCTAVEAASGTFTVWDEAAAVPLERAVASSCAVPGIYPPVTIGDGRYMDGGVRSPLNADLASGHDAVVVISVMPLELPFLDDERIQRFFSAQRAEIDGLRAAGAAVEVIVPDEEFLAVSGYMTSLMDFSLIQPAVDAGRRLGAASAERLAAIW